VAAPECVIFTHSLVSARPPYSRITLRFSAEAKVAPGRLKVIYGEGIPSVRRVSRETPLTVPGVRHRFGLFTCGARGATKAPKNGSGYASASGGFISNWHCGWGRVVVASHTKGISCQATERELKPVRQGRQET
jgi:hypothetical protein